MKYYIKQSEAPEPYASPDRWVVYVKRNKRERIIARFATRQEAQVKALMERGLDIVQELDAIQDGLQSLGAIDQGDPYGWRA